MLRACLAALLLAAPAAAATDIDDWDAVLAAAEGQSVYWHAWGGSTTTNAFIDWIGDRVAEEYGVTLAPLPPEDAAKQEPLTRAEPPPLDDNMEGEGEGI